MSQKHRYVVLRHEGFGELHYDLLWEWSPQFPLKSLRLNEWPITSATIIERTPDHRREYLDFEGPVSENRGEVQRIAEGSCTCEVDRADSSLLTLDDGTSIRVPRAQWD